MTRDFTIVFIHGWTASHLADWYPNISRELDKFDLDYVIPDLPGGEYPHAKDWLEVLHNTISQINKPLVLVGHSLGTRAALLYLEKYQPKVEKVFLIAALANRVQNAKRRNGVYADFFEHKINLQVVKGMANEFIIIHSKNDKSIPYEQAEELAKDLDAKLFPTAGKDDHFSDPENAQIILKELREELNF